jgi:hypothetical protein
VPVAAQGEAQVVARYPLTAADGSIGTVMSIVRCGSTLYVGDTDSRIHRIDIATGRVAAPLADASMMPLALAADCGRNRVWAISPLPRGRGLRAIPFDTETGKQAEAISVPTPCFPTTAVVSGDALFIGGECILGEIGERYVQPEAASYYSDKRIGVRLSLTSGKSQDGLPPYETECHGGGACVGGSIDTAGEGWIAALRSSARIGIYNNDGTLARTIPISSPAFVSDGMRLPASASSEQSVRWGTRNSQIGRAFVIGKHLVVAHYVTAVPPGWKMGGPDRPQFKVRMNVMTADGQPVHVDLPLPELPVGRDADALYAIDYGPAGRQGAHEAVTVVKIAVPVS